MAFEMEYEFDGLAFKIAGTEYADFRGIAQLSHDVGYGFIIEGISILSIDKLSGCDLNPKSDDPFLVELFNVLSKELYRDPDAQEAFGQALVEEQYEVSR